MKHVIFAAILMAPIAANASTGPDVPAIVAQLRCTWLTLQQAARGDFSQWVLPDFVPGPHLHAGEFPDCVRADGPAHPAPPPSAGLQTRPAPDGEKP